jgi:uncharacterized protein
MNCPVCNITLQMMERQNVEIDYCPQCRGVWLDRGELDKIIKRTGAEMPLMTIPQGNDSHSVRRDDEHYDKRYDDHYGGQRRKRGFLHDLFDWNPSRNDWVWLTIYLRDQNVTALPIMTDIIIVVSSMVMKAMVIIIPCWTLHRGSSVTKWFLLASCWRFWLWDTVDCRDSTLPWPSHLLLQTTRGPKVSWRQSHPFYRNFSRAQESSSMIFGILLLKATWRTLRKSGSMDLLHFRRWCLVK